MEHEDLGDFSRNYADQIWHLEYMKKKNTWRVNSF